MASIKILKGCVVGIDRTAKERDVLLIGKDVTDKDARYLIAIGKAVSVPDAKKAKHDVQD